MTHSDSSTNIDNPKDNNLGRPAKVRKHRAWELDFLRGFAIIMVVWDHFMYDCGYMFGYFWQTADNASLSRLADFGQNYFTSNLRHFWWPFFVFVFFFVSGICTAFSKNNLSRGLKLALVAVALSGITYIGEYVLGLSQVFILFGVLHCLASCILIYAVIELITKLINRRKNKWVLPAVCLVFTIAAFVLDSVYNVTLKEVVTSFATVDTDSKIAGLFVFQIDWWKADYFPLLPFFGSLCWEAHWDIFFTKTRNLLCQNWTGSGIAFLLYPADIHLSYTLYLKCW